MDRNNDSIDREKTCPAIENPLTTYARLLRQQIDLACELEQIADALPDRFDQHRCRELAEHIPAVFDVTLTVAHDFLHPVLVHRGAGDLFSRTTAERLRLERLMDQGYAVEINGLLLKLAGPRQSDDMNAAGYMLRGFFDNWRRACAFELEYVVPLATQHLTSEDLSEMASLLDRYRMVTAAACASTRLSVKTHSLH
jgi:hypothetical protein